MQEYSERSVAYVSINGQIKPVKNPKVKAYLFFDGCSDIWLPKSQTTITNKGEDGYCTVTIPEWLAQKKGLGG